MSDTEREQATCRGCGRLLDGEAYCYGGRAFIPLAAGERGPRKEAKANFYGGFVCTQGCDHRASLELERSMPGHDGRQMRLNDPAQRHLERNWG